jgi:photosystem II stability/assembly factor-like uncharacterized protein
MELRFAGGDTTRPSATKVVVALLMVCVALMALTPAVALGAGWTQQMSGTTWHLHDVDFADATHGWAVGNNGTIVATTDGATWKSQNSGTTKHLQAVDFVSATTGWAVGDGGTILTTTNGGSTWTTQSSGSSNPIYGVSFISLTQGWACGYSGLLLTTTNGGATWTRVVWPFGDGVLCTETWAAISIADATHGWMAGGKYVAWQTAPLWKLDYISGSYDATNVLGLDRVSAARAWAVGSKGSAGVIYTTGDGTAWQAQSTPAVTGWFTDVSCPTAANVWVSGYQGKVLASSNGGASWEVQDTGATQLEGICFLTAQKGWAVGYGGKIFAFGGSGPQPSGKPVPKALANVTIKKGKAGRLPYRIDGTTASCTVTIKIARKGKVVKVYTIRNVTPNKKLAKYFVCTFKKGTYSWSVTASADGVKSAKASTRKLIVN